MSPMLVAAEKTPTCIAGFDFISDGGIPKGRTTLLAGSAGSGRTLMVTHFVDGAASTGERCRLFAFEESREQRGRNAQSWGIDFDRMEQEGKLRVVCDYPASASIAGHLVRFKEHIGAQFRNVTGSLVGNPVQIAANEIERLDEMFTADVRS